MHVAAPVLVSQLHASAEVVDVYFRKTSDTAAIARAIQSQAPQNPVSIREDTPMTEVELEELRGALVNEIMSSLAAQLGIVPVYG